MSFIFTSSCFLLKKLFFLVLLCSFLSDFVIVTYLQEQTKTMKRQTFCTSVSYVLTLHYNVVSHKLN